MPSFVRSGAPVGVNTKTASSQSKSWMTALADGGFVVTWQTTDSTADGFSGAIKSQRFNAQGVAVGAEALVNNLGAGDQTAAQTASLANGGYIVTWQTSDTTQDGSGTAVKARLFDSTGAAVGGEFRVNSQTLLDQKDPTVAGLADGGFVVAWYTTDTAQDGSGWAIKAQRYNSAGAAVGAEFRVNATASGSQWKTDIAGLTNGGFVVTWQTGNDANSQVYGQLYGADGVKVGGQFVANGSITYDTLGKVAALPGGGFVVTWMTYDADSLGIRAQVFNASGAKVGSDFAVNSTSAGTQMDPDVASLADGTFLITWDDKGLGIKGQAFNASGQRIGGEFVVANGGAATGTGVAIAGLAGGKFAVSYTNNAGTPSGDDIELQMLQYDSTPNAPPQLGPDTLSLSKPENQTFVATLAATDSDGPYAVTYSIVGGADAARFSLNAATGQLSFVSAPNFEAPTDSNGDNVYQVIVRASDGELSDQQTISVTVTNVNEALVITSNGAGASAAISLAENQLAVTKVTAVDPEGAPITYSISGGADASRFQIDSSTGALSFVSSPDYEQPGDADGNNSYLVTVRASDGTWTDTQALTITVTNANDAPVITSNGGGSEAAVSVVEGTLAVTTVAASDLEGAALSYAISGGADASRFLIDAATGALTFVLNPDFEQPADADGNNVYLVTVRASDGQLSDTQALSITVTNVNERPIIVSNGGGTSASVQVDEGQAAVTTVVAVDPDGAGAVTYSITGGAHAGLFAINAATGALSFAAAPDYEAPLGGSNNFYTVTVTASDGQLSSFQSIQVSVRNVNEGVVFTSGANATAHENFTEAGFVAATDLDGDSVSFAIAGGADGALFEIDSATGALSFLAAPDYEAPADSDGDNVYQVVVSASDGTLSDVRAVSVTVENDDEPLTFVSGGGGDTAAITIAENDAWLFELEAVDPEGHVPTLGIAGGADAALFAYDPQTHMLRFLSLPNYEAPGDADGNNVYELVVSAYDGHNFDYQTIFVTVANAYDGLSFAAPNLGLAVPENGLTVGAVSASGEDGYAVAYQITGGNDASLFTVDPLTGAISWLAEPDFESPQDIGGDNVYDLIVRASDGTGTAFQAVAVTVGNVDEPVEIVSYGGAGSVSLTLDEGSAQVGSVEATDPEGVAPAYAIVGGADAGRFAIDSSTGELSFAPGARPDFEAPTDSDGNNVYEVTVAAAAGGTSVTQSFSISIADVDESLRFTSYNSDFQVSLVIGENSRDAAVVAAEDPENAAIVYSIVDSYDGASFTIDAQNGILRFLTAPDHEAPADLDGNNVYTVLVAATDGHFFDYQMISIQVGNVNEGVTIASAAAFAVGENSTAVATIAASDADGDPVGYAIAGGADAALFAIDAQTGALRFVSAPDYEAPADAGGNNVYDVTVSATDGSFTATKAVAVTVGNVNEAVTITSNGGGASAGVSMLENGTAVATVAASDADGGPVTYAIAGGADASRFVISATGVLAFVAAPNFEAPSDTGANNVYDVVVSASDGIFTDTQALAVTVGNVNEAVTITSNGGGASAGVSVAENGTAVVTVVGSDADGGAVSYAISGGADALRFTINAATGVLAFVAAPNFEAPSDAGANNVYDVIVSASDGAFTDTQALAVTVGNVNEAVTITSNGGGATAGVSVLENGTAVATVIASDADGGPVTYAIAGGADALRFTINAATGVLAFLAAPNYEAPSDAGANNVYDVIVSASDGAFTDTQAVAIAVGNVNEALVITSDGGGASASVSVAENGMSVTAVVAVDPEGAPATYSIVGGADAARFTINAQTGALKFVAAPDWELPADSNQDNVYAVIVRASDGQFTDDQALSISVTNVRDGNNVTGTAGSDSISDTSTNLALRTSNEEDLVFGRDGNDSIFGMAGDDELYGEAGNDVLVGGGGADRLLGGLGKDTFTYNAVSESTAASRDLIQDFSRAQADKISLSAIDANSLLSGNQAFTFIGASAFTNAAGQLRYEVSGGMTTIWGDVNGDGVADLQIQLSGSIVLAASDFVL